MTNELFSLQRSSTKTDENATRATSWFECFTDLSPEVHGIASPRQKCRRYGGSCVPVEDCATVHLYGQFRRSILTCDSDTICCLSERNFHSLYGNHKTSDVQDLSRRSRLPDWYKRWRCRQWRANGAHLNKPMCRRYGRWQAKYRL